VLAVAEEVRNAVRRLIREMYRPFDEATELVRCFGEAALTVTDSAQAEIRREPASSRRRPSPQKVSGGTAR